MNKELKPCPFCGSTRVRVMYSDINKAHVVYCTNCKTSTNIAVREEDAIYLWNKRAEPERTAKVENKWHWNCDPYDDSTSPTEAGYYRIIDEDGTEMTDYFFGEPRITGRGIGYWATCEKTILAWSRLEVNDGKA